ncbi:unnamed protein product [Urochloa humidicola]
MLLDNQAVKTILVDIPALGKQVPLATQSRVPQIKKEEKNQFSQYSTTHTWETNLMAAPAGSAKFQPVRGARRNQEMYCAPSKDWSLDDEHGDERGEHRGDDRGETEAPIVARASTAQAAAIRDLLRPATISVRDLHASAHETPRRRRPRSRGPLAR